MSRVGCSDGAASAFRWFRVCGLGSRVKGFKVESLRGLGGLGFEV